MPKRDLTAIAQGSSVDLQPLQRGRGLTGMLSARSGVALGNARRLPLEAIEVNHQQSRQSFDEGTLAELAESIRQHDVLQPIGVRRRDDRYEIIFGERRYRASAIAGKSDIPAIIYDDLTETDAAIITALENLQREDLDIEDEARQFAYLLQLTGLSQRKLAERLGVQFNYLSRRVRLLKRPDLMEEYRSGRKTLHQVIGMLEVGSPARDPDVATEGEAGGDSPTSASAVGDVSAQEGVSGGYSDGGGGDGEGGEDGESSEPYFELIEREDLPGFIVSRGYSGDSADGGKASPARGGQRQGGTHRGGARFRWRPVQQFYNWVGRARLTDVPADECTTLKVQLTQIKEALEKQIEQLEQLQVQDNVDNANDAGNEGGAEGGTAEQPGATNAPMEAEEIGETEGSA